MVEATATAAEVKAFIVMILQDDAGIDEENLGLVCSIASQLDTLLLTSCIRFAVAIVPCLPERWDPPADQRTSNDW